MNMLEIGKLYSSEDYYLMLYPDKVTAEEAAAVVQPASCCGISCWWPRGSGAMYWSERLGKPVSEVDKNVPLLVLNREGKYVEVLTGDRAGWIINEARLNIKEIG